MRRLGLERELVDRGVYQRTVSRFKDAGIVLPTFAQLADPDKIPDGVREALPAIDPDAPHALNLFRVHWYNDRARTGSAAVPDHVVLPPALTGVDAKVVVLFG